LPPQLTGDATQLTWFADSVLDYVYSSHVLEDFRDTQAVLSEWLRVLKSGGYLIIFCPDEQAYRKHCDRTGQPYNKHHVHEHFSLEFVMKSLAAIGQTKVVHSSPLVDIYCWEIVVEKV
jgi:ubiquinone/menaquinone biosynthesis C-methylase UbiE